MGWIALSFAVGFIFGYFFAWRQWRKRRYIMDGLLGILYNEFGKGHEP